MGTPGVGAGQALRKVLLRGLIVLGGTLLSRSRRDCAPVFLARTAGIRAVCSTPRYAVAFFCQAMEVVFFGQGRVHFC